MTVFELITQLQKYPADAPVLVTGYNDSRYDEATTANLILAQHDTNHDDYKLTRDRAAPLAFEAVVII